MEKIPDEYVKLLAEDAGRAAAKEVIQEMDILPRLKAIEHTLTSVRIGFGKMIGIAIGSSAAFAMVLKVIGVIK